MSIFKKFFNLLTEKNINDPFFGELKPNRFTSHRYWYGNVQFSPTGKKIKIYIFDLENEVSEEYRTFYIELENRYLEIKSQIADYLHKAYNESNGELALKDVWNKFVFVELSFPRQEGLRKKHYEWDMFFSYDENKPNFLVEMKNWEPVECYSGE